MADFNYQGFDQSGGRVSGVVSAQDLKEARESLKRNGVLVTELRPAQAAVGSLITSRLSFRSNKLSVDALEFFISELALLLEAGLKIDRALQLLQKGTTKPGISELLNHLVKEVRTGKQLSEAFSSYNQKFDPLLVNLLQIGEATGRLAIVCRQLADDLAFKKDLRSKVVQAVTYPLVILAVCIGAVLFIFNVIVPNMAGLFAGKTDLPVYTQMLLGTAAFFQQYQLFFVPVLALGYWLVMRAAKDPVMQLKLHRLMLQLPLFRTAVPAVERVRFCSSLAMMLRAGVAIDNALDLAAGSINNTILQAEIEVAITKIKRGDSLSKAFAQSAMFPEFLATLLSVGEESGELARVFADITQRGQREFTQWLMRLTALLEPLMIIVMGGIVGGVVVTMMLSITGTTDVGI